MITYEKYSDRADWLKKRHQSGAFGGSEIGAILGLNPYTSPYEVFHSKILPEPQEKSLGQPAFWGNANESVIADRWQYWDGTPEGMLKNYQNGHKVRKCRNVNRIVRNTDYPFLFANIDRMILRNSLNPDGGILEIKTVSGFIAKIYVNEIPVYNLSQVLLYMVVLKKHYAEIAQLEDGNKLRVTPIHLSDFDGVVEKFLERAEDMYFRVQEAKDIILNKPGLIEFGTLTQEGLAAVAHLEPDFIGLPSEQEFLKEQYRMDEDEPFIDGTAEALEIIKDYFIAKTKMDLLKKDKDRAGARLMKLFGSSQRIVFDDRAYASYRANKNGVRTLRFSSALESMIESEVQEKIGLC